MVWMVLEIGKRNIGYGVEIKQENGSIKRRQVVGAWEVYDHGSEVGHASSLP